MATFGQYERPPACPGIYLLRLEDKRTYVGKATNLQRRRAGHLWSTRSQYYGTSATFVVLEMYRELPNPVVLGEPLFTDRELRNRRDAWLHEREVAWIERINPTDNKQRPKSHLVRTG